MFSAVGIGPEHVRIKAQLQQATFLMYSWQLFQAEFICESIIDRTPSDEFTMEARHMLNATYAASDQHQRALAQLDLSIASFRQADNQLGISKSLLAQGNIYWWMARLEDAATAFEAAADIARTIGNYDLVAINAVGLASVCLEMADYPKALAASQEGMAINERAANREGVARHTYCLGYIQTRMGEKAAGLVNLKKAAARSNRYAARDCR